MEMSDHYAAAYAASGWNNCTDCGKALPPEEQYGEGEVLSIETMEPIVICLPCLIIRHCLAGAAYEEKALADDDPKGTCAAHHRGAIGAYKHVVQYIERKRDKKGA